MRWKELSSSAVAMSFTKHQYSEYTYDEDTFSIQHSHRADFKKCRDDCNAHWNDRTEHDEASHSGRQYNDEDPMDTYHDYWEAYYDTLDEKSDCDCDYDYEYNDFLDNQSDVYSEYSYEYNSEDWRDYDYNEDYDDDRHGEDYNDSDRHGEDCNDSNGNGEGLECGSVATYRE